jgi:tape measure domain-containing protein
MASIDDRIVRMEFDNASFERKMGSTIQSIEKLDKSISEVGSKNGLEKVQAEANRFSLAGMASAIDGISQKFSALSAVAFSVINNIVNKAVDAGLRMAKAFALDPLIQGFQEYELKLGSIQTIMAGSGESLEVVNQKLRELNEYSDRTIYSFADMTTNIGKFTNAGVDLDTAVASIQGIANVAAVSGANTEEASRAMYNFAQALSKGYVQLIDWKSIELANMGTAEFKQQLIDAAVAAGTLTKQGEEYVTMSGHALSATKGFNESLTDQWLTTEVLNSTLGDYADETTEIGKKAFAAAQDIKTFTQLIQTTKEAIGSGWSETFEIIIGNFDEAKQLWGGIGASIGDFVKKSSDARNEPLQGWKDLGGRDRLIIGLKTGFEALGKVLTAVKDAFREVFPPMTAERLMELTRAFGDFMQRLTPSAETLERIKRIFTGLFSVLSIGWEVIKEGVKFIASLVSELLGLGSGKIMEGIASIGDFVSKLREMLVEGGAIKRFFQGLTAAVKGPVQFVRELIGLIGEFFSAFTGGAGNAAEGAVDRISARFDNLGKALGSIGEVLSKLFGRVGEVLGDIWEQVSKWLGELGDKFSEAFSEGDFSKALDTLNTGLLGGLVLILRQFLKNGLSVDLSGGIFGGITDALDQLTGVLGAMQTNLKAEALMKIAIAIGILTASLVVLSMIDSAALTRALGAMAVGFGQLIGAFALLNKVGFSTISAAKLGIIAGGLILLASAMVILSVAVKILGSMSWGELLRGLIGVTVLLGVLTVATAIMSKTSGGMIRMGAGLLLIAVALNILAAAVKIFATMSWAEMGKGMVGIASGLLIMAGAMRLMPKGLAAQGVGLVLIAVSLRILANAVEAFAALSWGQMAKGLAGVAGGLVAIAIGMRLMPGNMLLVGAGLLAVSVSLLLIAKAMDAFGGMSWGEIAKGIVAMGAALLVLALGAHAMNGAVGGAVAIAIVSASLLILAKVIKEMASLSIAEIITALVALAAALAVLAAVAYAIMATGAIAALLALGVAIVLLGAGLALAGVGILSIAKALEILARTGTAAIQALLDIADQLILRIPMLMSQLAVGMLEMVTVFIEGLPVLVEALKLLLLELLQLIIEVMPKIQEALIAVFTMIIDTIRTLIPQIVQLGMDLILALLTGIRDNIEQIVTVGVEILVKFIEGITQAIPQYIDAIVNLIITFINTVAAQRQKIIDAAINLLIQFLSGITNNLAKVATAVVTMITTFLTTVASLAGRIVTAGVNALIQFLSGITNNLIKVVNAVGTMISSFVTAVGNNATKVAKAGTDALVKFLQGMTDNLQKIVTAVGTLITKFITSVGNEAQRIITAGTDMIIDLITGIGEAAADIADAAMETVVTFVDSLASSVETHSGELRSAGGRLVGAIIDGMTFGLAGKVARVGQSIVGGLRGAVGAVGSFLGIGSPSKLFMEIGDLMMEGMAVGIEENSNPEKVAVAQVVSMTDSVQQKLKKFSEVVNAVEITSPTITPVLDLTQVQRDAKLIGGMMPTASIPFNPAYIQAQTIARTATPVEDETTTAGATPGGDVVFNQTINAPTQLSTGDIYKQTRNQITMAKEELAIP